MTSAAQTTTAEPTRSLDSPPVRACLYRSGSPGREDCSPAEALDAVRGGNAVAWLDLVAPTPEELRKLAERLDLHPLAVEDALAEPQRPKLDRYPRHLFVAAYRLGYDPDTGELEPRELSVFVTDRVLVTVRQHPDALDPAELTGRWDQNVRLAEHGVGFLLHGLLDSVVDEQVGAVRRMDDAVEELEDVLLDDPSGGGPEVQHRGFVLRKTVTRARRIVAPTGELLRDLDRPGVGPGGESLVGEGLAPYYADVRDHAVRSAERLDGLRETVAAILDARLAIKSDQLNEISKKLTGWAAIVAVPTAVTGFYGQNVPYPGFEQWWGFMVSAGLTVGIAVLLYILFRRRDWL